MSDFFEVGHEFDNYVEQIDLNQICFVRCIYKYLPGNKGCQIFNEKTDRMEPVPLWDYETKIMFLNGQTEKVAFNEAGYKEFIERLYSKRKK